MNRRQFFGFLAIAPLAAIVPYMQPKRTIPAFNSLWRVWRIGKTERIVVTPKEPYYIDPKDVKGFERISWHD